MKYVLFVWLFGLCTAQAQNLTQYVNPFIGTGGHGHTWPGATVPFGAVQLSPDTRDDGYNDWDGCGGYHYSDSIIYGFSHTHLSGTGVADYCDILLMPGTGPVQLNSKVNGDVKAGYASYFQHSNETARPGYYSVFLEDDSIYAQLTATTRTGMHAYTFPAQTEKYILLDLTHRDKLLEGSYIEIVSPTKIQGLRRSSSWARDQWVYFAIEFSEPFYLGGIDDNGKKSQTVSALFEPTIVSSAELKAYFKFKSTAPETIMVKCAISSVNCAGAWANMQAENPGWDFKATMQQANDVWNKALNKIQVYDTDMAKRSLTAPDNSLVIFYTALYHCMIAPNIFEDVDGRYRGMDGQIHRPQPHTQYTVFSLWDTFRGLHPLLTIIEPERTGDFIQTFLQQYQEGGRLPVWELSGNETECMIGYHAVSVIADAAAKGIKGFDTKLALEAMLHSANDTIFGLVPYREKGFIESNEEPESVSRTLEYAYDDWCIGAFADAIGNKQVANEMYARGFNFIHLINENGFVQPRTNGGWYTPFDPYEVNFNFTEANSWQYAFFYPQYLPYIETTEEKKQLENRLDALFQATAKTSGREQADITGLIGQYAHGNEPSHHIAYLYNYTDAPAKSQKLVRTIMHDFYKNTPDGLIGNEDCGQMSAWYVLSAMGIYPVCPGKPEYDIVAPLFDSVHIQTGANVFTIAQLKHGKGLNAENTNVSIIEINQQRQLSLKINHADIANGGRMLIHTYPESEMSYMVNPSREAPALPIPEKAPIISANGTTFTKSLSIMLQAEPQQTLMCRVNNGPFIAYTGPIDIIGTSTVYAYAINTKTQAKSPTVKGTFVKIPQHFTVQYLTQYNNQYTGGGNNALVDGLHGGSDFRTGMWQGWWGEDMLLLVDLGKTTTIDTVGGEFLQDIRSWIWMPGSVQIEVSADGKNFTLLTTIQNTVPGDNYDSKEIKTFLQQVPPTEARYVKFKAVNAGPVPDWHPGKGGKSWVFCDEIWVK